jgi:hypothetical protein
MEENTLSFEENLKRFKKWNHLKPTTYGLWLGYTYTKKWSWIRWLI